MFSELSVDKSVELLIDHEDCNESGWILIFISYLIYYNHLFLQFMCTIKIRGHLISQIT